MRNHFFGRRNELLLDIDSEAQFRKFLKRLPAVLHLVILPVVVVSQRPHHYHAYARLRHRAEFPDLSALAVWLGSDLKRELANMSRWAAGATRPVLLIEYTKPKHWRKPDLVCSCPPKLRGRKFANCPHLMSAKGHKAEFGFLSTRLGHLRVKGFGHD
jgi:hypothetical protein